MEFICLIAYYCCLREPFGRLRDHLRQRIVGFGKGIPVAEALEAPEIYPHNHTN